MAGAPVASAVGLFNYQFTVEGDVFAKLDALTLAMAGPSLAGWLSTVMRDYMETRVDRRFAGEGDDAVGKWKPLSEATQQIRESMGYGGAHPINVRTGKLKKYAMSSKVTIQGELMATLQMPDDTGDIDTEKKFIAAQVGMFDARTQTGVAARPVLGLGTQDMIFAVSALGMFFDKIVGNAKGGKLTGMIV